MEAAHDPSLLNPLFALIRPELTRYCQARLDRGTSIHTGEDVAQEVCLAIMQALPAYRHESTTFWAFVFSIASRKVTDTYRRTSTAKRHTQLAADVPENGAPSVGPEEAALQRELATRMNGLLDALPTHQRSILVLRVQGGLSTAEAARVLGSTPGAIRVAQHRALTTIRRQIQARTENRSA